MCPEPESLRRLGDPAAKRTERLVSVIPRAFPTVISTTARGAPARPTIPSGFKQARTFASFPHGARGRNRTGKEISPRGILSPLRLPISPPGPHVEKMQLFRLPRRLAFVRWTKFPGLPPLRLPISPPGPHVEKMQLFRLPRRLAFVHWTKFPGLPSLRLPISPPGHTGISDTGFASAGPPFTKTYSGRHNVRLLRSYVYIEPVAAQAAIRRDGLYKYQRSSETTPTTGRNYSWSLRNQ